METQTIIDQQPLQPTTPAAPVIPPISQPVVDPVKLVASKKSPLIPILIILLVLSLSAAIYFFLQSRMVTPAPITSEGPTPVPTANIDPTADWQTHTYQLFTIKLPSNWSTTDVENPVQFLNYVIDPRGGGSFDPSTDKGKLKVEIYQNNSLDSLESYIAQQKSSAIESRGIEINWQETKEIVDGKEAIKVKTTNPGYTYNVKDISSNTIFSISFGLDFDNYKELSDQILQTFQFINTQTSSEKDEVRAFLTKFADSYSRGDWDTLQSMLTQAMQQDMETNKSSLGAGYNFDHYQITDLQKNSNGSFTATIQFELDGQPYTNAQGNPQVMVVNEDGEWKSMTWYLYE